MIYFHVFENFCHKKYFFLNFHSSWKYSLLNDDINWPWFVLNEFTYDHKICSYPGGWLLGIYQLINGIHKTHIVLPYPASSKCRITEQRWLLFQDNKFVLIMSRRSYSQTLLRVSATQHSSNASTISETIGITVLLVVLPFKHYIFQNSVDYAECSNNGCRTYSFRNMPPYTVVINRWRDVYDKNKSPDIPTGQASGGDGNVIVFFSVSVFAQNVLYLYWYTNIHWWW